MVSREYKSTKRSSPDDGDRVAGTPARSRELRAQGRKTMARLLDAGMKVFSQRGYQAARVDDIVRAARTSHGTFYLYFSDKVDLLRALATRCCDEWEALAGRIGEIGPDAAGREELHRFLGEFLDTYDRYGPVIRAWSERHVDDRQVRRLGVRAYRHIAAGMQQRMADAGAPSDEARISALMAMLERFAYIRSSRGIGADDAVVLDSLTATIHRGFFAVS